MSPDSDRQPLQVDLVKVAPVELKTTVQVQFQPGTEDPNKKAQAVYKAEETLHEKYQGYSTEVLRLSLTGVALLGFFFDKVGTVYDLTAQSRWWILFFMGVSAALFAVAAAASLAHRYYSTEGLYYCLRMHAGDNVPPGLDPNKPAIINDLLFLFLIWIGYVKRPTNAYSSMGKAVTQIANTGIGVAASFAALASCVLIVAFAIAVIGYKPSNKQTEPLKVAEQRPQTITMLWPLRYCGGFGPRNRCSNSLFP